MNFGTIRDSHLTIDLAGMVGPVGTGLMLLILIATGIAAVVILAVLARAVLTRQR